jgi:hypothetical protein
MTVFKAEIDLISKDITTLKETMGAKSEYEPLFKLLEEVSLAANELHTVLSMVNSMVGNGVAKYGLSQFEILNEKLTVHWEEINKITSDRRKFHLYKMICQEYQEKLKLVNEIRSSLLSSQTKKAGYPASIKQSPSSVDQSIIDTVQCDRRKFSLCSADYILSSTLFYYNEKVIDSLRDPVKYSNIHKRINLFRDHCEGRMDSFGLFYPIKSQAKANTDLFSPTKKGPNEREPSISKEKQMNENGLSAELTSILGDATEKITGELYPSSKSVFVWMHQATNMNPQGYYDVTCYELIDCKDCPLLDAFSTPPSSLVYYPILFFEFGKVGSYNIESKRPQSSAYANFIFRTQPIRRLDSMWTPVLGVIMIGMEEIEIRLYSLAIDTNLNSSVRVPEFVIYRGGIRDNDHFIQILALISYWQQVVSSMIRTDRNFLTPHESFKCYETYMPIPSRNVLIEETVNSIISHFPEELKTDMTNSELRVFKLFDKRSNTNSSYYRSTQYYYLPLFKDTFKNPKEVSYCDGNLRILSYDKLHGTHEPTKAEHFLLIFQRIYDLHKENLVHGDIRLMNMIFDDSITHRMDSLSLVNESKEKENTGTKFVSSIYFFLLIFILLILSAEPGFTAAEAWLIDLDFMAEHGKGKYPVGFNSDIPDAVRHRTARAGNPLLLVHDIFSLHSIMKFYKKNAKDVTGTWLEAVDKMQTLAKDLDYLGNKILTAALKVVYEDVVQYLRNIKDYELGSAEAPIEVQKHGTGSPPEHK